MATQQCWYLERARQEITWGGDGGGDRVLLIYHRGPSIYPLSLWHAKALADASFYILQITRFCAETLLETYDTPGSLRTPRISMRTEGMGDGKAC